MPDEKPPRKSDPPSTSPSSPDDTTAGEEWCEELERFVLDHEQAEALTRITVERAESWYARWASVLPEAESSALLVDRPTHPEALRRGLELYHRRRWFEGGVAEGVDD